MSFVLALKYLMTALRQGQPVRDSHTSHKLVTEGFPSPKNIFFPIKLSSSDIGDSIALPRASLFEESDSTVIDSRSCVLMLKID